MTGRGDNFIYIPPDGDCPQEPFVSILTRNGAPFVRLLQRDIPSKGRAAWRP
jgi:hypothetical protein